MFKKSRIFIFNKNQINHIEFKLQYDLIIKSILQTKYNKNKDIIKFIFSKHLIIFLSFLKLVQKNSIFKNLLNSNYLEIFQLLHIIEKTVIF